MLLFEKTKGNLKNYPKLNNKKDCFEKRKDNQYPYSSTYTPNILMAMQIKPKELKNKNQNF